MTYGAIKAEIRRRLAEAASGAVFFSDDDVADAAQLGYQEISDATEWNEQVLDVDLLTDQWYYDLRQIIGDTLLSVKPQFDRQTNRWLIPSTVKQLDTHDRRWERVTGEPQRTFLRGLWWLGFYPRIQADVGRIKLYHTALPAPLVEDDDEPGFPDTWHYAIVDFALTDLWAQDGESRLALTAWAAYLQSEAELAAWVNNRASDALTTGFGDPGTSVSR